MKNRKGISEIVGSIIVISVVVAGLGVYTSLSEQRILGDALSVKESIQQKDDQISELIEFVDMFQDSTQPDVIGVYVHNYGLKNVTISDVFVNGTIDMNTISNPVYVRDLVDENPISPNNRTIPVAKTSEIILNFTGEPQSPIIGIESVVIKTDSNKFFQIVNGTQ